MTVQELINALNKIEDKSKNIVWGIKEYDIWYIQESGKVIYLYEKMRI